MWLMQKLKFFSCANRISLANELKSIGNINAVLFLTIGKPDIYQHKSSGKLATDFYLSI
jgi:hypothetical protein